MTIDLGIVAQIAGYIVTISAACAIGVHAINKHIDKKLAPILSWTEHQQTDIDDAAERDSILIESQLASMEAIHDGKNNGNVTDAIAKLRDYITRRASKPSSYAKR